MSILFPIYHCLGRLKALLLTFNFEHHKRLLGRFAASHPLPLV
jgi:hypothetical protein